MHRGKSDNQNNRFSGRQKCVWGGERVTVYDWLRLIATLFVVIGHSAYTRMQTTYGGVDYALPETLNKAYNSYILIWFRNLAGWVYGFHMPLFFMLSGAVLALKPIAAFDKVVKAKVKRLIIPYYVYGWLFMLPVKRMGDFYSNDSLKEALKAFLSGSESGHLWFLIALFWCILVFVALEKVLSRVGIHSRYVLLMVCGLIQFVGVPYFPAEIPVLQTGMGYIFYYALGYTFEYERRLHEPWNMKQTMLAYFITLALEVMNMKYGVLDSFFVILAGAFMTYILADLCNRIFYKCKEHRWWRLIVRNLFYVYLLHDPLEYIVLKIFMKNNWLSIGIGCWMYTCSRIVIVFGVTIVLGECIEKMKVLLLKAIDSRLNSCPD